MAISPAQRPDDGGIVEGTSDRSAWSGTSDHDGDPTNMAGQYPPGSWGNALFGGPQPMGSGAPGTQGASYSSATDPTNEPGQLTEGLSGTTAAQDSQSGAPGSSTTPNTSSGGTSVTYTNPGAGVGTFHQTTMPAYLEGPMDSTQANDEGYGTGGPQIPGIKGNEPQAGSTKYQTGRGRVMRGGRAVRPLCLSPAPRTTTRTARSRESSPASTQRRTWANRTISPPISGLPIRDCPLTCQMTSRPLIPTQT